MANEEHLAILRQGADVWNAWRKANPEIRPDLWMTSLSGADLNKADLHDAALGDTDLGDSNLSFANLRDSNLNFAKLSGADLSFADLSFADLSEAKLGEADLSGADLSEAKLSGANLRESDLSEAKLSGADLSVAILTAADLTGANLSGADLSEAYLGSTILINLDLSQVKGLETVKHQGPSSIGIDTIYQSRGQIPEAFLRGAGVPDQFIEYMRSLVAEKAIEYYSYFISYCSKDEDFARRLYNDLQANNVRCWFAPEDLKIGDKFWERIDESIRIYDKLLVILSAQSVASEWVGDEVTRALTRERAQPGRLVLFPVRLDDAVLNARKPWASHLQMNRHIGDFCAWKNHDAYQVAFARLLRDLKSQPG